MSFFIFSNFLPPFLEEEKITVYEDGWRKKPHNIWRGRAGGYQRRCASEDKNKMSEMKSICCGGVWTRKRGAEGERLGGQEGKERWRVRLIYVACVRDNRKVKGYSRGLKGGGERQQRRRGTEWESIKGKDEWRGGVSLFAVFMAMLIRYAESLLLDSGHQDTVSAGDKSLRVWLYNGPQLIKYLDKVVFLSTIKSQDPYKLHYNT